MGANKIIDFLIAAESETWQRPVIDRVIEYNASDGALIRNLKDRNGTYIWSPQAVDCFDRMYPVMLCGIPVLYSADVAFKIHYIFDDYTSITVETDLDRLIS